MYRSVAKSEFLQGYSSYIKHGQYSHSMKCSKVYVMGSRSLFYNCVLCYVFDNVFGAGYIIKIVDSLRVVVEMLFKTGSLARGLVAPTWSPSFTIMSNV
jgi:hypothetical protein